MFYRLALHSSRLLNGAISETTILRGLAASNLFSRSFASAPTEEIDVARMRNFGISAHIDSGKTTLTERILYYTKIIHSIHEVKGKDGVGAVMDSMELEREKGITIQSAATHCLWKDYHLNIIDTPGHVDFTVEVERALRVLDGAILVLCGVGGVQSQSITVDRQMKRYHIPRLAFINKLDRQGSNPDRVIAQLRDKLKLNAAAVQVPIGLEDAHRGVVDIVRDRAVIFNGANGDDLQITEIPAELKSKVESAKSVLFERLSEVDEEMGELFLMEQKPSQEQLQNCIRRCTIAQTFVPVFMGSAFKNKGIQLLLDAVVDYLPAPNEVRNVALDLDHEEKEVVLSNRATEDLVALAFKLEESKYGQLTYLRTYQGLLNRGDMITNMRTRRSVKISRLVRMHSNEMEDVQSVGAGEIAAIFGIDCASGDTFTNNKIHYSMSSMYVPDTVISLAIKTHDHDGEMNFSKANHLMKCDTQALQRFTKEDPTFQTEYDQESKETIIKGMGELHLQIYVERMKREYKCAVDVGYPRVNYRETIGKKTEFNYLHKKQSGGSGQFGRVVGYIEPMDYEGTVKHEFVNGMVGNNIPPEFLPAIEKGFYEAIEKGRLLGYPVTGIRFVLLDGQAHSVDSNEIAFRTAAKMAVLESMMQANPILLEPMMSVDVEIPQEFQGAIIGGINRRKGAIISTNSDDRGNVSVEAEVALASMFGYSTELRSNTQGQGEFTMEFKTMTRVSKSVVDEMVRKAKAEKK